MRSEAVMRLPQLRVVGPTELTPAAARAKEERSARRLVLTLSGSVAGLTMLGLVMVLSASSVSAFAEYGSSFLFFQRQLVYAAFGTGVAVLASRIRYQVWQRMWLPLLGVTFVLLLLVLHPATGRVAGGSARWIEFGPITVQPSELAKFVLVAATAGILARNLRYLHDPVVWMVPLGIVVGTTSVLILLQPDLGTMMVIGLTVLLMMFVAGVRLRLLLASSSLAGLAGMLLIMGEGYRKARFLAFLHPWADPRNTGYQIVQSLIALGSGHLWGVGLGASRQKWMYVPNAHTDFIFSIMGEELGLAGELIVLGLFAAFVYAGVRIALRAPDAFGRLLAAGITMWLGLQALVNLGAVTGVLPITGVPLPFMSFGGSSLVVSLGAFGVLLSIARAGSAGRGGKGTGSRATRRAPAGVA
jgi:cell division protein FtsW